MQIPYYFPYSLRNTYNIGSSMINVINTFQIYSKYYGESARELTFSLFFFSNSQAMPSRSNPAAAALPARGTPCIPIYFVYKVLHNKDTLHIKH